MEIFTQRGIMIFSSEGIVISGYRGYFFKHEPFFFLENRNNVIVCQGIFLSSRSRSIFSGNILKRICDSCTSDERHLSQYRFCLFSPCNFLKNQYSKQNNS